VRSGARILPVLAGLSVLGGQQPAPPERPATLIYERQPLLIPFTCWSEDFEAAGLHCSEEEPCRLFLELTAVEAAGPQVLLVGNLHTSSATLSSLALSSEDAGTTWREPLARLPGAGFESVQLLNAQQGWISVQPQGAYASDPYLLATADGGSAWQKQPIWSEEGRAGFLQQFHFDTKDHGLALIDRSAAGAVTNRHELYETMNGGSSWTLRETSARPISPKWPLRRVSDWRLREDARLKTYEVERRAGQTWLRMANFRAELGMCKELKTKTPPPLTPADSPPPRNP